MLRYEDFILESVAKGMQLYYSDELRNILKAIHAKYDGTAERIAGVLILQESGGQSNYPYSLIDITEKNDKVSFVQANRYLKLHPDGEKPEKDNGFWKNGRTLEYSIGKFAQMVMKNVLKEVPGAQLEEFVNAYRTEYDLAQKGDSHTFEVVKGAEIEMRYLESSFVSKSDYAGNDSLHGSCMRKPGCAGFFNIYIENPDVCELLVMLDKEGKTMGRALLWTLDDGKRYMDRVYCVDTNTNLGKFYDWGKTNKIDYYYGLTPVAPADATVEVKGKEYKYYPYMDTFKYYDTEEGALTKSVPTNTEYVLYLQSTQGGGPLLEEEFRWSDSEGEWLDIDNSCYCSDIDDYVSSDFAIWLEYIGEYVSDRAETRYCQYDGNNYLEDDCVESVMMEDWIPREDAIKVITSTSGNGDSDWCHKEEKSLYVKIDGKYYSNKYTFDPYTEEWTFEFEEIKSKLAKEYVDNGVAKSSSGKFDKAMLRQDTRQMLVDWKGYLTSLPDFVAELFEGVPYEYAVYADIGLDGKFVYVKTGITDLVPAFIEYLVNGGFDARSEDSVANIAKEIYGDETIVPELKSSLGDYSADAVEVKKARLVAECFRQNSITLRKISPVKMPKLLKMPKPGEDLYKRWLLLRMI